MKIVKKIPKHYFIFLFVACLLMIPALINHGIHGDDATFHITNIMAMGQKFNFFHLPTRIRPLIANNFGYGSGIFYPEFIHIMILYLWKILSIFHLPLSVSIIVYMVIFITITASIMYHLLFKFTKDSTCSVIGSILYITFPYFLADIYRRSAYGELISFLTLPLIILGVYYLLYENNKTKFYIYFIVGFYLLFASHLISVVYTTLFVGIFLLFHLKEVFNKKNIIPFITASIIVLGLSLTYIIPVLEHKLAANYMVFEAGHMFSRKTVIKSCLSIKDLLLPGKWLNTYIPVVVLVLVGFLIFKIKEVKNKIPNKIINSTMAIFLVSLMLVLFSSIWKILPSFLITIQFVWRNCTYLAFAIIILSTFGLLVIPKNYKKIVNVIIILAVCFNTIFILSNNKYVTPTNTTFSFRDGGMGWNREYITKNTYKNINYFKNRDDSIKIINNNEAVIKNIENNTPNLKFDIIQTNKTLVEIPRFYYLWYSITLTNNNTTQKLEYYENNNGFIEFEIPKSGTVSVKYQKTLVSKCSDVVEIISIITFIMLIGCSYKKRKID